MQSPADQLSGNQPKLATGKPCASRDTDHIVVAAALEAFQERKRECMMSVQQGFAPQCCTCVGSDETGIDCRE
jgi:hypothetical protein